MVRIHNRTIYSIVILTLNENSGTPLAMQISKCYSMHVCVVIHYEYVPEYTIHASMAVV